MSLLQDDLALQHVANSSATKHDGETEKNRGRKRKKCCTLTTLRRERE